MCCVSWRALFSSYRNIFQGTELKETNYHIPLLLSCSSWLSQRRLQERAYFVTTLQKLEKKKILTGTRERGEKWIEPNKQKKMKKACFSFSSCGKKRRNCVQLCPMYSLWGREIIYIYVSRRLNETRKKGKRSAGNRLWIKGARETVHESWKKLWHEEEKQHSCKDFVPATDQIKA